MQILLACAKLMARTSDQSYNKIGHLPPFQKEADMIAAQMCNYSPAELSEMLNVNKEISIETHRRYNDFFDASTLRPAIETYDGIVFKKIEPETLTPDQLLYADSHINICSFVYGLLRPLDLINPYRMEGGVSLPGIGDKDLFDFWKPRLTDLLIERTKADDSILVNLASDEMRHLFEWKRITNELTVITPTFKVEKSGRMRTITIYTKMCRGAMTRFIITERLTTPLELTAFTFDGFSYISGSPANVPLFVMQPD